MPEHGAISKSSSTGPDRRSAPRPDEDQADAAGLHTPPSGPNFIWQPQAGTCILPGR